MADKNGRAQLMLTGDSTRKRLTVTDPVSGVTFLEVDLDAPAFLEFMSHTTTGSAEGVPAWYAEGLDRIGKYHAHVSARFPNVGRHTEGMPQSLDNWAAMAGRRIRAYSHSVSFHTGLVTSVIFRSYHPTESGADAWKVSARAQLDELLPMLPGAGR